MGCKPVSNVINELNLDLNEVKKVWCDVIVMENYTGDIYDALADRLNISRDNAKRVVFTMYYSIPHHKVMIFSEKLSTLEWTKKVLTSPKNINEPYNHLDNLIILAEKQYERASNFLHNRKPVSEQSEVK